MEVSFSNKIFTNKSRILDTEYMGFFNRRQKRMTFVFSTILGNEINRWVGLLYVTSVNMTVNLKS